MFAIQRMGGIFAIFMKASMRPPTMASGNASRMSPIEMSQPCHTVVTAMTAYCGWRNRFRKATEFHFATRDDRSSACPISSPMGGEANANVTSGTVLGRPSST